MKLTSRSDPATTAPPLSQSKVRDHRVLIGSVILAVAFVIGWWFASTRTFVIPSPVETIQALVSALGDPLYLRHIRATALASTIAIVLSISVGTLIGLAFGSFPALRKGLEPLVVASNGVPKLILYPVFLLFFGMGLVSKVVLGFLIGVFPMFMNVSAGVRDIPPLYRKLAQTLEATRFQTFWQIVVPAIRRPFLTGVRLAVSLSTIGVVLAEIISTQYGLGRVILASYSAAQYDRMSATVLLLFLTAFTVTVALWRVERSVR